MCFYIDQNRKYSQSTVKKISGQQSCIFTVLKTITFLKIIM